MATKTEYPEMPLTQTDQPYEVKSLSDYDVKITPGRVVDVGTEVLISVKFPSNRHPVLELLYSPEDFPAEPKKWTQENWRDRNVTFTIPVNQVGEYGFRLKASPTDETGDLIEIHGISEERKQELDAICEGFKKFV